MENFAISEMNSSIGNAPSFLIVCLRFIGDVLVSTPIAVSIKEFLPEAKIDYLVFEGTEVALAKNPLVNCVLTMPQGSRNALFALSLWNRYDFAIAAGPSDRTVIYSYLAGRIRTGLDYGYPRDFWKRFLLRNYVSYNDNIHVVWNMLKVLKPLGIPSVPRVIVGFDQDDRVFASERLPVERFVIMHPYSRNACKYWSAEKWKQLACMIVEKLGIKVVFTVTPSLEDSSFLNKIMCDVPSSVCRLPEIFSLNQLAAALTKADAYIGIDTVITHIAAMTGVPTVAIFGPTWTKYWAPWPNGCTEKSPFAPNKGVQSVSNVTVVQKEWDCVPCNQEVCAISERKKMECLEDLSVQEVFNALRISMKLEET